MCYRYSLAWGDDDLCTRFGVTGLPSGLVPHYSIAPGGTSLVITGPGEAEAAMMQWGLVPHWTRDVLSANRPANARAESLAAKPMFRDLVRTHRCLVPATGFFEWKQQWKTKAPFYFCRNDRSLFAFAGLYDVWRNPAGAALVTYTVVTTAANAVVAPVHHRMPVILRREDEVRWRSREVLPGAELRRILSPFPAEQMEGYPVSERVNDPAADDELVTRPVSRL